MLNAAAPPFPPRDTPLRRTSGFLILAFTFTFLFPALPVCAADTEEAVKMLRSGKYAEALAAAESALVTPGRDREEWFSVQLESLLAAGRYPDALTALEKALEHSPRSLRVQWLAREIYLANGKTDEAAGIPREIERLMGWLEGAYRDAPGITIFGKALLLQGTDPKTVLDKVYTPAQKLDPKARDPLLARGELALEKNDFALAAKTFQNALKLFPDDADFLCGLALAFAPSDRREMLAALEKALETNPKHVPALLRLAEHRIDAEEYEAAAALLDQIHAINPNRPELWALRAVLAHLKHDPAAEAEARNNGLKFWTANPLVDFLTGRKLSQKYRFAEGAARQRRALAFDPDYLPAKAQLASDLLRLGEEEEGWKLAAAVHKLDAYDTAAFNLMTLHDAMQAKFTTLQNGDFTVRMDAAEAKIYGPRVLELLGEARQKLGAKYGLEIDRPVIVEIFPKQKDFGVRTFGMPDNPGYLGVCFGRVVTATSPAARPGTAINWESVLWHEFCHTVTLQATQNKMPRWLSEGISVYEERQADASWGERMTPEYRGMILTGELTPVSRLSGAFLSPKSPLHLQFAYFEASLVVEFLIERHGLETLKTILADLREGTPLNDSLAKRTAPLESLEKDFAAHAERLAHEMSPGLDWEKPAPELLLPGSDAELAKWSAERPDNFHALMRRAVSALENKRWAEAKEPLQRVIDLYPQQTGPDSARVLLARAHRELKEADAERTVLTRFAEMDDEAPEAYLRLMELAAAAGDWPAVEKQARRHLAVNPLVPPPWNFLAEAAEKSGHADRAAEALQTLLNLDPPNPAALHWRLAQILHREGKPEARRHLLLALEEAPRHREALRLLLEMNRNSPAVTPEPVTVPPPATPAAEGAN